jgi:hypothetical protein
MTSTERGDSAADISDSENLLMGVVVKIVEDPPANFPGGPTPT